MNRINRWLLRTFVIIFMLPLMFMLCLFGLRVQGPDRVYERFGNAPYPEITPGAILPNLWNGTYQNDFTKWFNRNFSVRPLVVRTYNQFKYNVFGELNTVAGKDNYIFALDRSEMYALNERFSTDEELDEQTKKIRAIQDALMSRGKQV